jgi:hypothetical protein
MLILHDYRFRMVLSMFSTPSSTTIQVVLPLEQISQRGCYALCHLNLDVSTIVISSQCWLQGSLSLLQLVNKSTLPTRPSLPKHPARSRGSHQRTSSWLLLNKSQPASGRRAQQFTITSSSPSHPAFHCRAQPCRHAQLTIVPNLAVAPKPRPGWPSAWSTPSNKEKSLVSR